VICGWPRPSSIWRSSRVSGKPIPVSARCGGVKLLLADRRAEFDVVAVDHGLGSLCFGGGANYVEKLSILYFIEVASHKNLLRNNRKAVELIAEELIRRREISGTEGHAIIESAPFEPK